MTSPAPRLTVVIASTNDDRVLTQCVDALASQVASGDVEVLLVRALDRPSSLAGQGIAARASWLRWIDAPAQSTVPQLRGIGIAASRAGHIAMLEDDCVIGSDWCREAMTIQENAVAVGGAVEPGPYRRALDWAVYFAEYGRFMLPVPSTPNAPLTGNNVVYARRALLALPMAQQADFREAAIHDTWQGQGLLTCVNGSLVVRNIHSWSTQDITSVPFHHGRAFSAQRLQSRSAMMRAGFALLMPGLPFLKVARIVAEVVGRGRLVGHLVRALPWILVFVTSWSAGEFVGCLKGAGDSPSRWR